MKGVLASVYAISIASDILVFKDGLQPLWQDKLPQTVK